MSQSKKSKNQTTSTVEELLNVKDVEKTDIAALTSEFTSIPEAHISFKHLLMLETFRSVVNQLNGMIHSANDLERCKQSVRSVLQTAIAASLECEDVYNQYFDKVE